jgi:hypothetical protein
LAWRESQLSAFGEANSRFFAFGVPHEAEFLRIPPHETLKRRISATQNAKSREFSYIKHQKGGIRTTPNAESLD